MDDGRRDICKALLRARKGRVGLQQTPTCADRRVDGGGRKRAGPQGRHEGSQLHRGSCRAAGGRSLEREVDDTVDVLKPAEEALEGT